MRAKKFYSQNFLVDQTVIQKIIKAAEIKKGEMVLEIGPGTGTLTKALIDIGAKVIAIETDKDLIAPLKEKFGDKIKLIHGDALSLHHSMTPSLHDSITPSLHDFAYKLVSNIPYHITSQILEKFLTTSQRPSRMILMVQKEVADRITAKPPNMSLFSVVCQIYAHCERIAIVKAGAFRPIPKVDSAIIKLDLFDQNNQEKVIALAKKGFSSKRKQLKTNLGGYIAEKLEQLDLNPKIRAQELTVEDWKRLV